MFEVYGLVVKGKCARSSVLIEQESEFKFSLVNQKARKLTTGIATSYIDYLNNVTNHLSIDIILSTVVSENDICNIESQLSETERLDGSRRNCKSAMKAYLEFQAQSKRMDISIYHDEIDRHFEGSSKQVTVNKYERNTKVRKACINHYQAVCQVYNLNFLKLTKNMK
ncbi:hypothetical protein [Candidatus Enterovibrio escicola]|uniref:hypothetical protein n=1 Tax=Candidatus Enterovibrio escicola TaxID=1927127 RepID=UPI0018F19170|nr:hypothetical protein [Candidatus Enterovibrio escacola]